jgi:hypothetical protein
MKKFFPILIIIFLFGSGNMYAQCKKNDVLNNGKACCDKSKTTAQADVKTQKTSSDEVVVYYFHATRRCATCEAVEKVTKETLAEKYGDQIIFKSINREERENKDMVEKYDVSGQTLLLVKGNQKKDLTTDAFLYARNSPEKLKKELIASLDEMLK